MTSDAQRRWVCWVDAMERVYPDRWPSHDEAAAELTAAAGGCTAILLAVRAHQAGDLRVEFDGWEGNSSWPSPTWFCLEHVAVNGNMGKPGAPQAEVTRGQLKHLVRRAPFRVYEVMHPGQECRADKGRTVAFLAMFELPPDAESGRHTFHVRVTHPGGNTVLEGALTVHQARWPQPQRLGLTNWTALNRLLYPYPEVALDSPRHWELIEQLLAWLRRGGQDTVLLPWFVDAHQPLFPLAQPRWEEDGTMSFDFTRLDRFVQLALRLGFERLEGGHLGHKRRIEGYRLDTTCADIYAAIPHPGGVRQRRFDSPPARRFLSAFLDALRLHLEARGWSDRYVQHIADEPFRPVSESYLQAVAWVREQWPGVRLMDAASTHGAAHALDIPIPESDYLDPHLPFYQRLARSGKQVWFYTCCWPAVPWLNRFLDFHLNKGGLLPWVVFRYGLAGYLHWGANQWGRRGAYANRGDSGDGWILFPGPNGPLPTLRWLALRLGVEDHELLCSLVDHGQADAAHQLAASLVTSNTHYCCDTALVREARRRLRQLAATAATENS